MTDDRDPWLETLFAQAQPDLDADSFTTRVMARARYQRYRLVAIWGVVALALTLCAWVLGIPQQFARVVVEFLTIPLYDLGGGWLAWAFTPVNNIGSLLVLAAKLARVMLKKARRASWK